MGKKVIEVEGLGKEYQLGMVAKDSIKDTIGGMFKGQRTKDTFWALRDVNLSVEEGEVLGIVGKNGAGKSTLLKLLSRITYPTEGHFTMRGRVASLLEVGTGFHPELSGRENVFLNGAILGMSRKEIRNKFDEIVAFSGVEKFIDTPVKHYSSGMYVRLAFSVAAHLEPEILIIDEVLAVGDAEFQKKCLGKMNDVAGEGRTVLFVSHNMAAVQSLCSRAVFIEKGSLQFSGPPVKAIDEYLKNSQQKGQMKAVREASTMKKTPPVLLEEVSVSGKEEEESPIFSGGDCYVKLKVNLKSESKVALRLDFFNTQNDMLFITNNFHSHEEFALAGGSHELLCHLQNLPLYEGDYRIAVNCYHNREVVDTVENAISFQVNGADFYGTGKLSPKKLGLVLQQNTWRQLS